MNVEIACDWNRDNRYVHLEIGCVLIITILIGFGFGIGIRWEQSAMIGIGIGDDHRESANRYASDRWWLLWWRYD